jgi:outer membrane usher protein
VEGSGFEAVVGYGGETYLEKLRAHNRIRVKTPERACEASFDYPSTAAGAIPRIGPLSCLETAP